MKTNHPIDAKTTGATLFYSFQRICLGLSLCVLLKPVVIVILNMDKHRSLKCIILYMVINCAGAFIFLFIVMVVLFQWENPAVPVA